MVDPSLAGDRATAPSLAFCPVIRARPFPSLLGKSYTLTELQKSDLMASGSPLFSPPFSSLLLLPPPPPPFGVLRVPLTRLIGDMCAATPRGTRALIFSHHPVRGMKLTVSAEVPRKVRTPCCEAYSRKRERKSLRSCPSEQLSPPSTAFVSLLSPITSCPVQSSVTQ